MTYVGFNQLKMACVTLPLTIVLIEKLTHYSLVQARYDAWHDCNAIL